MAVKELTMEELKELFASTIESKLKELGLDKVDIKHGMIPQETKAQEEEFEKLSKEERFRVFLKSVIEKDFKVVKALGGTTDSEGGYLIPTEFRKEIIESLITVGVMRPRVRVIKVAERTGNIPTLTNRPNYSWGTENSAFSESEPAFGQIAYAVKRLDVFSAISRELLADSMIDLTSMIKELFVESYAKAEDEAMSEGDGTTIPVVGVGKDASIAELALTDALTYDDLVDAFWSLKEGYRKSAIFMTSPLGVQVLRKLKDANGNPILVPATQGGAPTIFGRPVIENPYLEDTLVDPDKTPNSGDEYYTAKIILGDFKYAYLFDRGEFGIEATKEGGNAFLNHQILIKSWNRIDFKVVLGEAFVRVTGVK
jgi:HK97 family phage major capsid protein